MCSGKITKVYIEPTGIPAVKMQRFYSWSPNLFTLEKNTWHQAVLHVISWGFLSKRISEYFESPWTIGPQTRQDVHLSGWHGYRTIDDLLDCCRKGEKPNYYWILLRGLIYESDSGEISGSEMMILRRDHDLYKTSLRAAWPFVAHSMYL